MSCAWTVCRKLFIRDTDCWILISCLQEAEDGIIVYDDCGVKLTIPYQAKDVEGSTNPQIGDKVRELSVLLGNAVLGFVGCELLFAFTWNKWGTRHVCDITWNVVFKWVKKYPLDTEEGEYSLMSILAWETMEKGKAWRIGKSNKILRSHSGYCL